MKKLLLILLFIPLFLISCSGDVTPPEISNSEIDDIMNKKNQTDDGNEEIKYVSDFDNYVDAFNEFGRRLNKLPKFKQIAEGSTEAFIVTQNIYSSLEKDGNKYIIYNTSNSSMKDQYHEAIFSDNITYRNNKEEQFTEISLADYKTEYGVTPYDGTVFDCIINENTVSKIERELVEDNYQFTLELNVETDTAKYLQLQMKKLGDLGDYPQFKSIKLTLVVSNDFTPISGKIEAEYNIKYGIFSIGCNQVLNVRYEL